MLGDLGSLGQLLGTKSSLLLKFLSVVPVLPTGFPLFELLLVDELFLRVLSPFGGCGLVVVIITGPVGPLELVGAVSITSPLASQFCSSSSS